MANYSYIISPLVVVAALGLIVLLCRWVFSTSSRDTRNAAQRQRERARGDYGLLTPVATVRTREDAEVLRQVLRDAGIRGTVAAAEGGVAVLVFPSDVARARGLVSS